MGVSNGKKMKAIAIAVKSCLEQTCQTPQKRSQGLGHPDDLNRATMPSHVREQIPLAFLVAALSMQPALALPPRQEPVPTSQQSPAQAPIVKERTLDQVAGSRVAASARRSRELVVVDWTVPGYQPLIAELAPDIPVIVLPRGQSGLHGLATALSDYHDLDAIHLVTEGHGGAIQLGAEWVGDAAVDAHQADVQAIGKVLKPGGDLLLYGCSVAAGASGEKFLKNLSQALGHVDVAASSNKTGPTALGGDWDLEWSSGHIETPVFKSAAFQRLLAGTIAATNVVQVASGRDFMDSTPGTTPISVLGSAGLSNNSRVVLLANGEGDYFGSFNLENLQVAIIDTSGTVTFHSLAGSSPHGALNKGGFYWSQTNDNASVIGLKNGGFVVTASSNFGYGAALFDNAGTQIPITLPTHFTTEPSNPTARSIPTNDGGFILIWTENNLWQLYFQRYNSAGAQVGGEGFLNTQPYVPNLYSGVAVDKDGNLAVSIGSNDVFTKSTVRIWNSSNNLVATVTADYYQTPAAICAQAGGGFVLFGNDLYSDNGNTSAAFHVQTMDAAGTLGGVIQNVVPVASGIGLAQVELLSTGDYLAIDGSHNGYIVSGSSPSGATTYQVFSAADAAKFPKNPSADFDAEITAAWLTNTGTTKVVETYGTYYLVTRGTVSVATYALAGTSNTAPAFVTTSTANLTVQENSSNTDISSYLAITDPDASQTETWSVSTATNHGGTVTIGGTQPSGAGTITPTGMYYHPATGFVGTETFSIQVSDGTAVATRSFSVSVNNTAPTISAGTDTLTGTQDDTPSAAVQIATLLAGSGVNYADVNGTSIRGIAITSSTLAGSAGSWQWSANGSSGWTNFSVASAAVSIVLDSSAYVRFNPSPGNDGTASFTWLGWDETDGASSGQTVNAGTTGGSTAFSSTSRTADLLVSAPDALPVVTTSGGSAAFVAGDNVVATPVVVDGGVTVTDADNATLASATVSITANLHASEDVLAFTNTDAATFGNIVASYDGGTGTLSLASAGATATLAQWQAALRAVTYTDTAVTPNAATRTVTFIANDGVANSLAATRSITVTAVDQTPIVTTTGGSTAFTAGDNVAATPVAVDAGLTVSDADNATLASATVSITANLHASEDVLAFTNTNATTFGNIAASYDGGTGTLSLASAGATATLAQWQAALRAVTYTDTAVTPNTAVRTVDFMVSDGSKSSALASKSITVTAVDQTPIVTTSGGSTAFTAGDNVAATPVTVDAGVTVSDADNATLASATVSITANLHAGEDVLAFSNTSATTFGNIAASYDGGTGILSLSSSGATATLAQWQAALRAVTYTDTAVTPNTAVRTVSFVVNDGSKNSTGASKTVTVTAVDQTPIVTTSGGSTAFTAGDGVPGTPVAVDAGVTVSDADNATLASATVSITANLHASEDVLAFSNTSATTFGNIAASYDGGTGTLSLVSAGSTATLAQWQAALRAVTYTDTAVTPNTAVRTVSFVVNDGSKSSTGASKSVTVTAVDQAPIVTTSGGSTAFTAGDNVAATPVTVDTGVMVTDADNATLASATVSITANLHASEDVLAFSNTSATTFGNIVASYNGGTGVLNLTSSGATATLAQWQAALRAVTYTDTAVTPNTAARTVSFVVSDGSKSSTGASKSVTVTAVDQTPIVITSGGSTVVSGGSGPVVVDGGLTVTDSDNATLAGATVSITGNFHAGEDVLAFTNTGFGNIVGSYNAPTGVLTLTSAGATATLAQWQAALRSVTYRDTAVTPNSATRTVSFVANDGTKSSAAAVKSIAMAGIPQTITFNPLSSRALGSGSFTLSATGGGSSNPVVFSSQTSAVCSVAGTAVTLLDIGTCTIAANQSGNASYADAAQVVRSFYVVTDSVTRSSPSGSGTITIAVDTGQSNCGLTRVQHLASLASGAPPGLTLPYGTASFTIAGDCSLGTTATVSIAYPRPLPDNAQVWKFGSTADNHTGHWYRLTAANSVQISGNTITYTLTDGGLGDDDYTADGTINDPVAAALPMSTTGIPAIGPEGRGMLSLLLAVMAWLGLRFRRKD